ncbi:MAG: hypothetical protein QMD22_10800 [archaeon]|nr:hypothetical protein [archaeon]
MVKLFFKPLQGLRSRGAEPHIRKGLYAMETIRLKGDGDAVKSEMVVEAVEQGIRIREVGIGIWGDGKISGGFD